MESDRGAGVCSARRRARIQWKVLCGSGEGQGRLSHAGAPGPQLRCPPRCVVRPRKTPDRHSVLKISFSKGSAALRAIVVVLLPLGTARRSPSWTGERSAGRSRVPRRRRARMAGIPAAVVAPTGVRGAQVGWNGLFRCSIVAVCRSPSWRLSRTERSACRHRDSVASKYATDTQTSLVSPIAGRRPRHPPVRAMPVRLRLFRGRRYTSALLGPEANVALQCVIGDAELPARAPLVVLAALEHEPGIATAPGPHRLLPSERRRQDSRNSARAVTAEDRAGAADPIRRARWPARRPAGALERCQATRTPSRASEADCDNRSRRTVR